MNKETRKLLQAMAKAAGVAEDKMLEIIIRQAAEVGGFLAEEEPFHYPIPARFARQYRDTQSLRPDLIQQIWKARIASANWRARNLGISGELTLDGWMAVLEKYGGRCAKCGSSEYICIDHTIPFAHNGLNIDSNIQPLCRDCNTDKGITERRLSAS